jgi:hypothetical protein
MKANKILWIDSNDVEQLLEDNVDNKLFNALFNMNEDIKCLKEDLENGKRTESVD